MLIWPRKVGFSTMMMLFGTCVPKITIRQSNLLSWYDSQVRRLKKKQAWTKAKKFRAHHLEKN